MAEQVTGRASGASHPANRPLLLAASLLGFSGLADVLAGTAMLGPSPYVTVLDGTMYHLDLSTWGWFHLLTGVVSMSAGAFILTARRVALLLGLLVTVFSVAVDVMTVPYEPYRATMAAGLGVGVLRLLVRNRGGPRPGGLPG